MIEQEVCAPNFQISDQEGDTLIPLVIVSGLTCNQIQATLHGSHPHHWYCSSNSGKYNLWMEETNFYPFAVDCWFDNFQIQYDPVTKNYTYPEGVEVTIPYYGGMNQLI
jgi:hypothetical protein